MKVIKQKNGKLRKKRAKPEPDRRPELIRYMDQFTPYIRERERIGNAALLKEYKSRKCTKRRRRELQDIIVYGNMPLVANKAFAYIGLGVPLIELIQEGSIGLMKAIKKYKRNKGAKFSTYAVFWIKQVMLRAITDTGNLRCYRVPVHVYDRLSVVARQTHIFVRENSYWPSAEEVLVRIKKLDIKSAEEIKLSHVKLCQEIMLQGSFSLNENAPTQNMINGSQNETLVADVIHLYADPVALFNAADTLAKFQKTIANVLEQVRSLPKKRIPDILYHRLNFARLEKTMSLEEISQDYPVSRERVRQLEVIGLKVLKKRLGMTKSDIQKMMDSIDILEEMVSHLDADPKAN